MFRARLVLFAAAVSVAARLPAETFVDQLGGAIRSGHVDLTFELAAGKVPLTPAWSIETTGSPRAHLLAEADEGRLTRFAFAVDGGDLIVAGRGLRPDVVVQAVEADGTHGITSARFHGRGFFGKIVIGLFRGIGMSAVRKMKFRTDLPSVFRGDILVHEAPAAPKPEAAPPPPSSSPGGPSLFDLVRKITVARSELVAYPSRPLAFEPVVSFRTAPSGDPVRLSVDEASWRPARGAEPSRLDVDGRIDGRFVDGAMAYSGERLSFSSGELRGAHVRIRSDESGKSVSSLAADRVDLDLTSGRFIVPPGGIRVAVEAPSRFSAAPLSVAETGKVSGVLDFDLRGKTGEWRRNGVAVALSDVAVRSPRLDVDENAATGEVSLDFDYRLVYPFTVSYPVKEIEPHRVDLVFAGPLHAALALDRAGDAERGRVEGTYTLKTPWAPIERAAFEAMRARWSEDLTAIRKVDFTLEPSQFGPCGESCFVAKFNVVAEKKRGKRSIFRAECAPEGKANLVIDKETGTMRLENMKIETHCKGIASVVNFLAPFFAKAYSDVTLFRMPDDSPLTVDAVRSGTEWIELSGRVRWTASAASPPR
jgi:hypothetical protein